MPPLPDITAGLASATPAAQSVFNAFKTPMYFDLGITIGAIVLVFLIVAFKDAILNLLHLDDNSSWDVGWSDYYKKHPNAKFMRTMDNKKKFID